MYARGGGGAGTDAVERASVGEELGRRETRPTLPIIAPNHPLPSADQRALWLDISSSSGSSLDLATPSNPAVLPPGL